MGKIAHHITVWLVVYVLVVGLPLIKRHQSQQRKEAFKNINHQTPTGKHIFAKVICNTL